MKYYIYLRTLSYTHIYYTTIDEFLTHIPPCKGCLIQPMCMFMGVYIDENGTKPKLHVKACKDLDEFMKRKKCFKYMFKETNNKHG